jgi:hypothetical protein
MCEANGMMIERTRYGRTNPLGNSQRRVSAPRRGDGVLPRGMSAPRRGMGGWLLLAALVCGWTGAPVQGESTWTVDDATTTVVFHHERLSALDLTLEAGGADRGKHAFRMSAGADSDLTLSEADGVLEAFVAGGLRHPVAITVTDGTVTDGTVTDGTVTDGTVTDGARRIALEHFAIIPAHSGGAQRLALGSLAGAPAFDVGEVKMAFDRVSGRLFVEGARVAIGAALAEALNRPELAGEVVASISLMADFRFEQGDAPDFADAAEVRGGGTVCGRPGPDVIVGELPDIDSYGSEGGIAAFSVATTSCNVGDAELNWFASTNQHPVIGQNMYRLKDGRFEQVGISWLKHGFFAVSGNECLCGCSPTDGTVLGVGCSDPYDAFLNGRQVDLGPRFEVNAATGVFSYPFFAEGQTGGQIYKRLQVAISDLDPAQDGGGQYFVEGQYVSPDDTAAGNNDNNVSYRPATIGNSGGFWFANVTGATVREQEAIRAWQTFDPTVELTDVNIDSDGLVIVGSKSVALGNGLHAYEYAVQNVYSDRSIGSFSIPIGPGANVSSIGFHDVSYHSGEPYDGTDWVGTYDGQNITWATTDYSVNPDANALRWGTLYNFRFVADRSRSGSTATLGLFKPGTPASVTAGVIGPQVSGIMCATAVGDGDGDCDVDLADYSLLQDCFSGSGSGYPASCMCFDADQDGDIDLGDLATMQAPWTGPGVPVGGCTP